MRRLDRKVLMVTGATRGIGLAAAERLAAEGARLVLPLPEGRASSLVRYHTLGRRLLRYRIRRGDTLDLIADRFDVTPYEIRRWNGLRSPRIIAGRTLRIYVHTGPGTSGARSSTRRKSSRSAAGRSAGAQASR